MSDNAWLGIGLNPNATSVDLMALDTGFMLQRTLDMGSEGEIRFDMLVRAEDAGGLGTRVGDLANLLEQAEPRTLRPHDEWVVITLQWEGQPGPTHYMLERGSISKDEPHPTREGVVVHFDLLARPEGVLEPVVYTQTATLNNGSIEVAIPDVPGNQSALLRVEVEDVSTSGAYITSIMGAIRSGEGITTSDWDPVVDTPAAVGASNVPDDPGSIGLAYASRTLGTSWLDVASTVVPDGPYQRALRDVWARVRAVATALSYASNPVATINQPVTTTQSVTEPGTVYAQPTTPPLVAGGADTAGSGASPTVAVAQTMQTAGIAFALVRARVSSLGGVSTGASTLGPSTSGWQRVTSENVGPDVVQLWMKPPGVAPGGTTHTWTLDRQSTDAPFPSIRVLQVEVRNPEALDNLAIEFSGADSAFWSINAGSTIYPNSLVVAAFIAAGMATTGSLWTAGTTEMYDANGMMAGWRLAAEAGHNTATSVVASAAAPEWSGFAFGIRGIGTAGSVVTAEEVVTTYPGTLAAGARTFSVYPVDAGGRVGTPRSVAVTVPVDGCSVALQWPDPAAGTVDHWIIQWSFGGQVYRIYTANATSEYVVTGEADAVLATALPALPAASAADNLVRIRTGQAVGALWDGTPQRVPADNVWRWMLLGTAVELPPGGRMLDGEYADGRIVVAGASGGGASPALHVDALWMPAHHEPSWFAEYPGLSGPGAAGNVWRMESDVWGEGCRGWLLDGDGDPAGALLAVGPMLAAPGDNVLALLCRGAAGVATIANIKVKVTVTVWPRTAWIG